MSALPQIQKNAQRVIDKFGPVSGLAQFGYDADSIAYLDSFIDRQGESFRANEPRLDRMVSLMGAFLGEAIIATYGGAWSEDEDGIRLFILRGPEMHVLQPFHKVHKRIMNGPEDSLHFYFAEFLPYIFSQSTRAPWWRRLWSLFSRS